VATLTVALLQLAGRGPDADAAADRGEAACREAAQRGADVALFPELWNVGYAVPEDGAARAAWPSHAIARDGAWVGRFRALAAELEMAVAVTFLERWPGAPRDSVVVIDRRGQVALTYAKVHTCDFGPEAACTPGDAFPVCELDTAGGPVRVGTMICFDREFPEVARLLMLGGAEVVLVPNACELEVNRLSQLRARAFENVLAIATANYAAPRFNGRSVTYDGIGFDEERRSRDMTLVEAGDGEGVHLARIDLDALRAHRRREILGDAYRRPRLYGALTRDDAQPPFVRRDARR
jgi:N-carbamoylputrescine amidase